MIKSDNTKLERAIAILDLPPTLALIKEFNYLADTATGAEARKIGELYGALFLKVSENRELFVEAMEKGLI